MAKVFEDERLKFPKFQQDWQYGQRQHLLGEEYLIVKPTNNVDWGHNVKQIDFDILRTDNVLFGPETRFVFTLAFKKRRRGQTRIGK